MLVDISMPHLNGYQIAQQIRGESAFDAVLIVSVSSITGAEHDRIATAAGIDRQITKPICPRTLESAITAGLAQREKINRAS